MRIVQQTSIIVMLVFALGFVLGGATPAPAGEHPEKQAGSKSEHPEKQAGSKSEHPEKQQGAEKKALSKETLAEGIELFVSWMGGFQSGYFLAFDEAQDKPIVLTLEKVHRERLASLGDGEYFACADFKSTDGQIYDLDIFMTETKVGGFNGLLPVQVTVHKKAGKARYTWYEDDGVWKRKHS